MKEITDIIEEIVNNLDYTIEIKSVTDLGDDVKQLGVCNTLHIQPQCSTVVINATVYEVGNILNNEWIQITTPDVINVGDIIEVTPPKYFHGTIPATNQELSEIKADSDKLPMVYLFEVIDEDFIYNEEDITQRESRLVLFFLAGADFDNWYTDDHYNGAILPMRNLNFLFLDYIDAQRCTFQEMERVKVKNHAKWGLYRGEKGHEKNLFNDQLSGTECRITLKVNKNLTSNEACNC